MMESTRTLSLDTIAILDKTSTMLVAAAVHGYYFPEFVFIPGQFVRHDE